MTSLLEVEALTAAYGQVTALRSVSISVAPGEAVAIIGANGAGKSTMLRTLAGLHRPASGTVCLAGHDVTGLPAETMVRCGASLVPEGRQIFAELSVRDNLLLGAYQRRRSADVDESVDEVLTLFPPLRSRVKQFAGNLSGGEQQMLAVGRAVMSQPRLLLLDEPSLGLAPQAVRNIVDRFFVLVQQGMSILLVEQNTQAALRLASRGYVLERGKLVLSGNRDQLMENPHVQAAFLGTAPGLASESAPGSERAI